MLNFNFIISTAYESAYGNAYDLPLKKQFSKPKIYNAKGDLTKRWYVYFSYRDPSTGKLMRQTPFYGNANTYKTKEERMAVLTIYRNIILKYLNEGYSPYEDNELKNPTSEDIKDDLLEQEVPQELEEELPNTEPEIETSQAKQLGVKEAFEFVMTIKERDLRESSLRTLRSHNKIFIAWIEKNRPDVSSIEDIDRSTIKTFLNHINLSNSSRTVNNYRASLSSIFATLFESDMVPSNCVEKIRKLSTKPVKHERYSKTDQKRIFKYLEDNDPLMLLYIKFVAYSFLRPIEVCRLCVGDLDLKKKTISFVPKNGAWKTHRIPDILLNDIPDLSKMDKKAILFTAEGIGKFTDTKLENRRSYFTSRFKRLVSKEFDLSFEHTLYSFRHTFITMLYKEHRKSHAPFEAKSRVMHITGHTSMQSLESYLRGMDVELPDDYSHMLEQQLKEDG